MFGPDPRAADLDLVRVRSSAEPAQFEIPRASDELPRRPRAVGERDDLARIAVSEEPLQMGGHRDLAVRHQRPLVCGSVDGGRSREVGGHAQVDRDQVDVSAFQ
jgi:hypothetical protein